MRHLNEYRDSKRVHQLLAKIQNAVKGEWTIMEICGGQTHSLLKYNIPGLLPQNIEMVHGPGCPVCVTPAEKIDKAIQLAMQKDVVLASYGDMLRVPGSKDDLLTAKAQGGDIRVVYSPLDALKIAEQSPHKEVVFFSIGFETTAPANAISVAEAHRKGVKNYSLLSSHVLVPPAMEAILSSNDNRIDGFLAAGHVCTVMGYSEYLPLVRQYEKPITVTGFEPVDLLEGILETVTMLEEGEYEVKNAYKRSVRFEGNIPARHLLNEIFEVVDREWRGIGTIPNSGLDLKEKYAEYDAEKRFLMEDFKTQPNNGCEAGEILKGIKKPLDCIKFGSLCTPEHPLGAPMVSAEGACSAYFRYKRLNHDT